MTIGKRKGFTAKGAGAAPGNDANKKVGGSLSKNDHWYIQQGFGFSGNKDAREIIKDIHELLKPIKANQITDWGRAPDVAILNDEGIPVMSLNVDLSKYFWYHHSAADTLDKVDFHDFNKCVAAMAIMAFVIADLDRPLPR